MLKLRIITAIFLILVVVLSMVYLNITWFAVAAALFVTLAAWEWADLCALQPIWQKLIYVAFMLASLYLLAYAPIPIILASSVIFWLAALVCILTFGRLQAFWHKQRVITCIAGFGVLLPFWLSLVIIKAEPTSLLLFAFIVVLVAGADTTAYLFGRRFGKSKLLPSVSPGKTQVGFFASLIWGIVYSIAYGLYINIPLKSHVYLALAAVTLVAMSLVGDLFESMIKRIKGVKNSGKLLPGHGGILDRIDSLTAALPLFVFILWLGLI